MPEKASRACEICLLRHAERQLVELHRNENGRFANLLSMAAPLPADYDTDVSSEQMGSPMSKRHSRRASDWSVSRRPEAAQPPAGPQPAAQYSAAQPANGTPGRGGDAEAALPAPKIQPVFRPIRSPAAAAPQKPAAAAVDGGAADAGAATDGQDTQMVQILLQQVLCTDHRSNVLTL